MAYFKFMHVLSFLLFVWLDILSQITRKSGFGASDELSSEEEEGVQPVELIHPASDQERQHASTWPPSETGASVRRRSLNSMATPTLRPQVKFGVLFIEQVFKIDHSMQGLNNYFKHWNRKWVGIPSKWSLERWIASGQGWALVLPPTPMTRCGRSFSRGLTPPPRRAATVRWTGGTTPAWRSHQPPLWAVTMRACSRGSPE